MIKFLNKRFPTESFPNLLIHLYYLMISATFCYLYYHKFINRADFYGKQSTGGIYAVLNFEAVKPIQFRILIPLIFKGIRDIVSIFHSIPDKMLFFLITIALCYFILLSFYFLLNEYFKSKAINSWLSSIIIYPMIWNYVIMNGQFFYMDFSVLLIIILGFYCIVSEKYNWLLVVFLLGLVNHPSVGYLIPAFLLYNYKKLLQSRAIIYVLLMSAMYVGGYKIMDYVFQGSAGYFVMYNLPRNLGIYFELPLHIIARDAFFNFGALHIFLIIFLFSGLWKRYKGPMLYINLVIIPYILSVMVNFSIEEIRNYIAIIPFVVILALLFLSTFQNPFLKVTEKVLPNEVNNTN